jgi:hypothetical protein
MKDHIERMHKDIKCSLDEEAKKKLSDEIQELKIVV